MFPAAFQLTYQNVAKYCLGSLFKSKICFACGLVLLEVCCPWRFWLQAKQRKPTWRPEMRKPGYLFNITISNSTYETMRLNRLSQSTGARQPMLKVFWSLIAVEARRTKSARNCWETEPPRKEVQWKILKGSTHLVAKRIQKNVLAYTKMCKTCHVFHDFLKWLCTWVGHHKGRTTWGLCLCFLHGSLERCFLGNRSVDSVMLCESLNLWFQVFWPVRKAFHLSVKPLLSRICFLLILLGGMVAAGHFQKDLHKKESKKMVLDFSRHAATDCNCKRGTGKRTPVSPAMSDSVCWCQLLHVASQALRIQNHCNIYSKPFWTRCLNPMGRDHYWPLPPASSRLETETPKVATESSACPRKALTRSSSRPKRRFQNLTCPESMVYPYHGTTKNNTRKSPLSIQKPESGLLFTKSSQGRGQLTLCFHGDICQDLLSNAYNDTCGSWSLDNQKCLENFHEIISQLPEISGASPMMDLNNSFTGSWLSLLSFITSIALGTDTSICPLYSVHYLPLP